MKSLYKYLRPERVDVLAKAMIRYTQPGAFNDVFETKPYIPSLSSPSEMKETIDGLLPAELQKAHSELPELVRSVVPLELLSNLFEQHRGHFDAMIDTMATGIMPGIRCAFTHKLDELLGILSLTQDPANLLMWAHYADDHKGFVIGFDATHPYFDERRTPEDEMRHLRKVEYRDVRPQIPLAGLNGVDAFLVKSSHWSYEREWRITRALPDADMSLDEEPFPVCLFRYPAEAVLEVILGCRMANESKQAIVKTLRDNERFKRAKITQAVPNEREFRLDFIAVGV